MENKLKELFSDNSENYKGRITFDSSEAYQEFIKSLNQMYDDGEPVKIRGVKAMLVDAVDGNNQYSIESDLDIIETIIYPQREEVKIPIDVNNKLEEILFIKKVLKEKFTLETMENAVVQIKLTSDIKEKTIKFSYTTHIENAKDISVLIYEYKKVLALIDKLFDSNEIFLERDEMKLFFKESILLFERVHELEKMLNIDIDPSIFNDERHHRYLEMLYFLLVCNKKIRSNEKLNFVENAEITDESVGKTLFGVYIEELVVDIFSQKIIIFTVNCIFNAVISDVSIAENGNKKVLFTDTDSNPMFRSYSGHLSMSKAEEEQKEILKNFESYESAPYLWQLLEQKSS